MLNGIAYDAARDRLFVTGKNWPHLYEIDLVPRAAQPDPLTEFVTPDLIRGPPS